MNYLLHSNFFADTYNCGAYGNGSYDQNQCITVATGGLSATGTDVVIGIASGVVLIAIAVVLILRNRKKK